MTSFSLQQASTLTLLSGKNLFLGGLKILKKQQEAGLGRPWWFITNKLQQNDTKFHHNINIYWTLILQMFNFNIFKVIFINQGGWVWWAAPCSAKTKLNNNNTGNLWDHQQPNHAYDTRLLVTPYEQLCTFNL